MVPTTLSEGTFVDACRQLKAQEAAKKQGSSQKQSGGADVQSKAPTTTQSKADDLKVLLPLLHRAI